MREGGRRGVVPPHEDGSLHLRCPRCLRPILLAEQALFHKTSLCTACCLNAVPKTPSVPNGPLS